MVAGETAGNPGRSGIQTVVRSLAGAFGERRASVRLVMWNARNRWLRPLSPQLGLGPAAEPLRDPPSRLPLALLWQPPAWHWWLIAGGKRQVRAAAPASAAPAGSARLLGAFVGTNVRRWKS